MGWSVELDQARIIEEWPEFAGAATAEHTTVAGISHGVLQIQCDSTTWATELRRLRAEMLTRLLREYPDAEIRDLRFIAPGAPSWRHGPRTVRGEDPETPTDRTSKNQAVGFQFPLFAANCSENWPHTVRCCLNALARERSLLNDYPDWGAVPPPTPES
nr:DUF721 domain-containing protein [Leucobacter insecticola]